MLRALRVLLLTLCVAACLPFGAFAEDDLFQADEASIKDLLSDKPYTPKSFTVDMSYDALVENLPRKPVRTRLTFELNSSALTESSKKILGYVADALKELPGAKVLVAGHADTSGSDALNLKLSTKRAQAVADFLINTCKLEASRFVVAGYGEMYPLKGIPGTSSDNRRVEFIRTE